MHSLFPLFPVQTREKGTEANEENEEKYFKLDRRAGKLREPAVWKA